MWCMAKITLTENVIIITGASSGIGEATALRFAAQGCRVVLAARRLDRIKTLAEKIQDSGGETLAVQTDVSQPDSLFNLVKTTVNQWGQIDLLFNNAGFGRLKFLEELDPVSDIEAQLRVNLWGVIHLTRLVLPYMIERRRGHIINMASIAGLVAMPTYSIYAASKFAVRGFTDALRREVAMSGIRVSGIYPGSVETEFKMHSGTRRKTGIHTPRFLTLSADDVAREIIKVAYHPRRMVVIPRIMLPTIWFSSYFPGITDWIVKQTFVRRERSKQ
jgi:NADP-dependent 3-hydroxy acid dehydrogenase YdfG